MAYYGKILIRNGKLSLHAANYSIRIMDLAGTISFEKRPRGDS